MAVSYRASFLLASRRDGFIRSTCAHPLIDFGQLKFPQSPNLVRWQTLPLAPAVDGVFHYAKVQGNLFGCNPRFGVHGIGTQAMTFIVVLNRSESNWMAA